MEMQDLILQLGRDAAPVRPLPAPASRAALWLLISIPYAAAISLALLVWGEALVPVLNARFLLEETALAATAIMAAIAAFCCIIPGRDRRVGLLPLVPLVVWLASLTYACLGQWLQSGSIDLGLPVDWSYFIKLTAIGFVPMAAMIVMLRRGAPLQPRVSLALGTLAVAALGNLGLRFFHANEVAVTVLMCDLGAVVLLTALASWIGPRILFWRHLKLNTKH